MDNDSGVVYQEVRLILPRPGPPTPGPDWLSVSPSQTSPSQTSSPSLLVVVHFSLRRIFSQLLLQVNKRLPLVATRPH